MGIFDQDVDDKVSLAVPQLYMRGIEQLEWSQPKFWYVSSSVAACSPAFVLIGLARLGFTCSMDYTSP